MADIITYEAQEDESVPYLFDPKTMLLETNDTVLREKNEEMFKAVFGEDIDQDIRPDTNAGALIRMLTERDISTVALIAYMQNQQNILFATGSNLDMLGNAKGLLRHPATRATVVATVTGTPTLRVSRGLRASSNKGDVFIAAEDFVIQENGEASVRFISEEARAISVNVGELITLLDNIEGVKGIFNNDPSVAGSNQETDKAFRERIKSSFFLTASMTPVSLRTFILQHSPETLDVKIFNNNTNKAMNIDGTTLPTGNFWVIAYGGITELIAESIYLKAGGTPMIGDTTYEYTDKDNRLKYKICFSFAKPVKFDVVIKSKKNINNLVDKINQAFDELRSGIVKDESIMRINSDITRAGIIQFLTRQIPNLNLTEVSIGTFSDEDKDKELANKILDLLKEINTLENKENRTSDEDKKLTEDSLKLFMYRYVAHMLNTVKDSQSIFTANDITLIESRVMDDITDYSNQQIIKDIIIKIKPDSGNDFTVSNFLKAFVQGAINYVNLTQDSIYTWALTVERTFTKQEIIKIKANEIGVPNLVKVISDNG